MATFVCSRVSRRIAYASDTNSRHGSTFRGTGNYMFFGLQRTSVTPFHARAAHNTPRKKSSLNNFLMKAFPGNITAKCESFSARGARGGEIFHCVWHGQGSGGTGTKIRKKWACNCWKNFLLGIAGNWICLNNEVQFVCLIWRLHRSVSELIDRFQWMNIIRWTLGHPMSNTASAFIFRPTGVEVFQKQDLEVFW